VKSNIIFILFSFLIDLSDEQHLFNQHLSNGKTLLYIACQEGKLEIVDFLIESGLNPFIKTKGAYSESCLQVACRWGYTRIVRLLLEKVYYNREQVEETLYMEGISNEIRLIIEEYISKKFANRTCLSCFNVFNCFKV
jgi:ankyrin repeat protein